MRDPITLISAVDHSRQLGSLYEVIMEIAIKEEVSPKLLDLISMACDANNEIYYAIEKAVNDE